MITKYKATLILLDREVVVVHSTSLSRKKFATSYEMLSSKRSEVTKQVVL